MVSGASDTEPVASLWCVWEGVGVNSKLCTRCGKWCHKRCIGLSSLNTTQDFVCPGCTAEPRNPGERLIHVDGEVVEVVNSFCYLGGVMSSEEGVERSIKARTAAA